MSKDVIANFAEATKALVRDWSENYLKDVDRKLEEIKHAWDSSLNRLRFEMQWYTLKDAVRLKGGNYTTVKNKPSLQPRAGIPDHLLHGVKVWSRETVKEWIAITDERRPAYLRQVLPQLNKKTEAR